MSKSILKAFAVFLLVLWTAPSAHAQSQYRAAVTKLWISEFQAFPIFTTNPIFSGSVVNLQPESVRFSSTRCYPPLKDEKQRYRHIADYTSAVSVAIAADLSVQGQLLSKRLVDLEASTGAAAEVTTVLAVSPLSVDEFKPDIQALRKVNGGNKDCQLILQLLDGKAAGALVAAKVFHGQLRYTVIVHEKANASAKAHSDLLAAIGKTFQITGAGIKVSGQTVSFQASSTNAEQTLAIVPERLNVEELARITAYMQGKKGAELETAVQVAMGKSDPLGLRIAVNEIRSLLGSEIKKHEEWAQRFVSGEKMETPETIRTEYKRSVDLRKVGTYAAAMELANSERVAPPSLQAAIR